MWPCLLSIRDQPKQSNLCLPNQLNHGFCLREGKECGKSELARPTSEAESAMARRKNFQLTIEIASAEESVG